MKATVVDLRYKMNDVLKALDRNEKVTVLLIKEHFEIGFCIINNNLSNQLNYLRPRKKSSVCKLPNR